MLRDCFAGGAAVVIDGMARWPMGGRRGVSVTTRLSVLRTEYVTEYSVLRTEGGLDVRGGGVGEVGLDYRGV